MPDRESPESRRAVTRQSWLSRAQAGSFARDIFGGLGRRFRPRANVLHCFVVPRDGQPAHQASAEDHGDRGDCGEWDATAGNEEITADNNTGGADHHDPELCERQR